MSGDPCCQRRAIAYPWTGPSATTFRINRSRVPWGRSDFVIEDHAYGFYIYHIRCPFWRLARVADLVQLPSSVISPCWTEILLTKPRSPAYCGACAATGGSGGRVHF